MLSLVSETVTGAVVIRAFGATYELRAFERLQRLVDLNNTVALTTAVGSVSAGHLLVVCNSTLASSFHRAGLRCASS